MRTVLVTVGTDHHPFDRLMTWVADLRSNRPAVRFIVQHGSTQPPEHVEAYAMMSPAQLRQAMLSADVVISHGGPASIFDARSSGHVPIVVPRERAFGEHVDDHQVRFATKLSLDGTVRLARTGDQFVEAVESALASNRRLRQAGPPPAVEKAVTTFAGLVERLVDPPQVRRLPGVSNGPTLPVRAIGTGRHYADPAHDLSAG